MRVMGVDYGTVRVGVALSDPLGVLAQGLETIRVKKQDPDFVINRLVELVQQHGVGTVVVGLPRRTDARVGASELNARALADALRDKLDIPVVLQDERFTSVIANRILSESTVRRDKRRDVVDQVAAEVILNTYLEQLRKAAADGGATPTSL